MPPLGPFMGAIPDPQDPRDRWHDPPAGGGLPAAYTLPTPPPTDQGPSNACVAHAVCASLCIQGFPTSELWVYHCARKLTGSIQRDEGTHIRSALKIAATHGLLPAGRAPWDPAKVFSAATAGQYIQAFARRLASYERIPLHTLETSVRHELTQGRPPVFWAEVDDKFMATKNTWVPGGAKRGRHALCITGYDNTGVRVLNSWGVGWGNEGHGVIPWGVLATHCGDFWAVRLS